MSTSEPMSAERWQQCKQALMSYTDKTIWACDLICEMNRLRSAPAQQLTGDDDSVAHARNTVPVDVVADVDRGIAPLVAALNKIPGVRTFASCEGHPHSTAGNTSPYVMLYVGDVKQVAIVAEAIEAAVSSAPAQPELDSLEREYKGAQPEQPRNQTLERAREIAKEHEHDWRFPQPCMSGGKQYCGICNILREDAIRNDEIRRLTQPEHGDVEAAQGVLTCLFCGEPADHKCGDDHDCGNCCGMRGGLAHQDARTYKWLHDIVRPHLKKLKDAASVTAALRAELAERDADDEACINCNNEILEKYEADLDALRAELEDERDAKDALGVENERLKEQAAEHTRWVLLNAVDKFENERLQGELAEWKAKQAESFAFYEDAVRQLEACRGELAQMREALRECLHWCPDCEGDMEKPCDFCTKQRNAISSTTSSSAWLAQHDREVAAGAVLRTPPASEEQEKYGIACLKTIRMEPAHPPDFSKFPPEIVLFVKSAQFAWDIWQESGADDGTLADIQWWLAAAIQEYAASNDSEVAAKALRDAADADFIRLQPSWEQVAEWLRKGKCK